MLSWRRLNPGYETRRSHFGLSGSALEAGFSRVRSRFAPNAITRRNPAAAYGDAAFHPGRPGALLNRAPPPSAPGTAFGTLVMCALRRETQSPPRPMAVSFSADYLKQP